MEVFSSKVTGIGFDAILDGFTQQRRANEDAGIAVPVSGSLDRTLINRARFAALKAQRELPAKRKHDFVDHKVWSA